MHTMIRWLVRAAMVGVAVSWFSAAQAEPRVDAAIWTAAGVARLPGSMEAPPLRLADLSGQPVDLQQFRGRLVMVYFWATW